MPGALTAWAGGYSFEVIRARLLFDEIARQATQTTIRKKLRRAAGAHLGFCIPGRPSPPLYKTVFEEQVIEHGPHIPVLIQLLEDVRNS